MNFGDQEMHYGAPYLCRSDPHAAKGATSIPSRNIRVRRLADANHFQACQGFFPILVPLDDLHDWSRCIDALQTVRCRSFKCWLGLLGAVTIEDVLLRHRSGS